MEYPNQGFKTILDSHSQKIDVFLDHILSLESNLQRIKRPETLLKAMRYGTLNSGKRIRPFLVIESTNLLDGDHEKALPIAAALECVHCYSLIHDDLPQMDNDDWRRGQPTVHRAFGGATAILAGDSLLTLAFEIIADPQKTKIPSEHKVELILALSRAAGVDGMAGGQALDLQKQTKTLEKKDIIRIQSMKTGALIRFACEAGAIISAANHEHQKRLSEFGTIIGQAFQIADDLLDATSSLNQIGKTTGKDAKAEKATFIELQGIEQTQDELFSLIERAKTLLDFYGEAGILMKKMADFVAHRSY